MFPESYKNVNQTIVEKYLNYDSGIFIEAGGADGYTQSNTWHLEKYKNWTGILVEPNADAADKCRAERPNSIVYNYALVSDAYENDSLELVKRLVYEGDPGLMSAPSKSPIWKNEEWTRSVTNYDRTETISVSATTLTSILDNHKFSEIDFLSLDVEGYELEALKGLNLKKYSPKVILLECFSDFEDIENLLKPTHKFAEKLSDHDYVFLRNEE